MVFICDLRPCYKENPVNPKSCCANLENVQTKGIVSQAQKLSPVVNKCKIEILNRTPHDNLSSVVFCVNIFKVMFPSRKFFDAAFISILAPERKL